MRNLVFALSLYLPISLLSQTLAGNSFLSGEGQMVSIKSRYVTNENYIIQIHLPDGYNEESDEKYPVLYLLEGDRSFGMAKDMVDWLCKANEIEKLILVSVGYGNRIENIEAKQIRDFTPSQDKTITQPEYENAGGARNFLNFIQKELIPTIDMRYKTNEKRVFIGYENSALFGAFVLLLNYKIFTDYVFIAPSFQWDYKYIFKIEEAASMMNKDIKANVLMMYGLNESAEKMITPVKQFAESLRKRNYPGLTISIREYDGETHYSVYPIALQYSIKTLFKK